ncbi:TolC family protein, partial [uncultured Desulfovibrio sp.]
EVYQNARAGAKTAEANYALANERYKTVGTLSDLIGAQSRLTEAEVRISKALADFQTARVRLFFNMGLRNPTLR